MSITTVAFHICEHSLTYISCALVINHPKVLCFSFAKWYPFMSHYYKSSHKPPFSLHTFDFIFSVCENVFLVSPIYLLYILLYKLFMKTDETTINTSVQSLFEWNMVGCRPRNSFFSVVANFCYQVQDQVAKLILW